VIPFAHAAFALASVLAVAPAVQAFDSASSPIPAQGILQAAFTPWDNIESLIVEAIDAGKEQVLVQAYLLTSKKIAATLVAAHRRGVDVKVLADAEQHAKTGSSKLTELAAVGISVRLETKYQNAHNKIIVIDAMTSNPVVITGSFNFTWTAQHKNAENVLVARKNASLASRYVLNWERHWQDAVTFRR
jgi:phosphatidylserine/phosphatidylglycerophosphate/cardiolipin synthase-like enzyme